MQIARESQQNAPTFFTGVLKINAIREEVLVTDITKRSVRLCVWTCLFLVWVGLGGSGGEREPVL